MKKKLLYFFRLIIGKKTPGSISKSYAPGLMLYRINRLMQDKEPFLQPGYSIKDMAKDLQMPTHQLSTYINQQNGIHFNEYMNRFRITYCASLLKKASGKKLTVQELSVKCGFHNRNTFTTAFKKFTGHYPSEYVYYEKP